MTQSYPGGHLTLPREVEKRFQESKKEKGSQEAQTHKHEWK